MKGLILCAAVCVCVCMSYGDWEKTSSLGGMPQILALKIGPQGKLYAGTDEGLSVSNNDGSSWSAISGLEPDVDVIEVASGLLAVHSGLGVRVRQTGSSTWDEAGGYTSCILYAGGTLYCGLVDFIYKQAENAWEGQTVGHESEFRALALMDNTVYGIGLESVYSTTAGSGNWTRRGDSPAALLSENENEVTSLIAVGSHLFAGFYGGGVYCSYNLGEEWEDKSAGLDEYSDEPCVSELGYADVGGVVILFAATSDGVFVSLDYGGQWQEWNDGLDDTNLYAMAVSATYAYVGGQDGDVWRRSVSEFTTSVRRSSRGSVPAPGKSIIDMRRDHMTLRRGRWQDTGELAIYSASGQRLCRMLVGAGNSIVQLRCPSTGVLISRTHSHGSHTAGAMAVLR